MGHLVPDCPGQRALKPSCFIYLALMSLYVQYVVGFYIAVGRFGFVAAGVGMQAVPWGCKHWLELSGKTSGYHARLGF